MSLTRQQGTAWRGLIASVVLTIVACLAFVGCVGSPIPSAPGVARIGDTGSMRPTFVGGELCFVQPTPFAELKSGLIVLTFFGGAWHPHRLLFKRLGRWITKGDANAVPDLHPMTEENYGGTITQ